MPKKLTKEDKILIGQCKAEKNRMLKQIKEYSNRALAEKFNVTHGTISRVPVHK